MGSDSFSCSSNFAKNSRYFHPLDLGQNRDDHQKPVFSRQIALRIDLKRVDSERFRLQSHQKTGFFSIPMHEQVKR